MTLFVTHYPQITTLASMYPNVKNVHLRTSIDANSLPSPSAAPSVSLSPIHTPLKYLHEVGAGPCDMKSGYGIIMAEQSGFPRHVIDDARQLRSVVRDQFPVLVQEHHATDRSVSAVTSLLQHLLMLKNSTMSDAAMRQHLQSIRDRIPDRAALDMLQWLRTSSGRTNNHPINPCESALESNIGLTMTPRKERASDRDDEDQHHRSSKAQCGNIELV